MLDQLEGVSGAVRQISFKQLMALQEAGVRLDTICVISFASVLRAIDKRIKILLSSGRFGKQLRARKQSNG